MRSPFAKRFPNRWSNRWLSRWSTEGAMSGEPNLPRETSSLETALLAVLLLLAALLLPALVSNAQAQVRPILARQTPFQGLKLGEEVVIARCLHFSVRNFTDRSSATDHFDWVNVRVRNACDNVRRHLLVELVLVDAIGRPYGGRIWVLQGGERLWPGRSKIANFAIPDPDDLIPVRWAVRALKVEAPRQRRRFRRVSKHIHAERTPLAALNDSTLSLDSPAL